MRPKTRLTQLGESLAHGLHSTSQRPLPARCLHDQVRVVALDRVVDHPEPLTITGAPKAAPPLPQEAGVPQGRDPAPSP